MTILNNGKFYLGNGEWTDRMGIDDDGIFCDPNEADGKVINMNGRYILPGFEDAHSHPAGMGRVLAELDLRAMDITWMEAKDLIRNYVKSDKKEWILIHGWNEVAWKDVKKEELDSLTDDRGVLLINVSYHGGLLNSRGAKLLSGAGIKVPASGYLNEDLFEEAMILTSPSVESYLKIIPAYQRRLVSLGITAAHEMNISTLAELESYWELARSKELIISTVLYINPRLLDSTKKLSGFINSPDPTVRIAGLKLFLDGAIGTHTAAMSRSYDDVPENGILRTNFEECAKTIKRAVGLGLKQVAMHCIGDRAINLAVEVFTKLKDVYPDVLWRFEHFELPNERAIETLARYNGAAVMQPNFSWDAGNYHSRIGERIKAINPFRKILDKKVKLVFGSDDMPSGPLEGIRWATIKAPFTGQRVSVDEAILAYTRAGAEIVGEDDKRGKIAMSYEANFAVLNKNPLTDIKDCEVEETWIRGEKVFSKE